MKLSLVLSESVTDKLVRVCRHFDLDPLEVLLEAPGVVAGTIKAMAETGGVAGVVKDSPEGSWVGAVPLPSLEEFRLSPSCMFVQAMIACPAGGAPLRGAIIEATFADALIKETNVYLKAASAIEVVGYSIWIYLALLDAAREKGGEFGVLCESSRRFYRLQR